MQNNGAVRVDDALGETGGAGSEAHSGAVVFIELGYWNCHRLRRGVARSSRILADLVTATEDTTITCSKGTFWRTFRRREGARRRSVGAIGSVISDGGNFV